MFSFVDWFEAVRYRWKLVAVATATLVVLALLYLSVSPKTYRAEASLIVDTEQPDPVAEDGAAGGSNNNKSIMATQADLIRTPRVAAEAAVAAGLDKDPSYVAEWQEQTGGRTPYGEWLKAKMLSSLEVLPGKDTNILIVSTKGDTPLEAERLANGFASAAVASRYRLRTEPAKAYASWLEGRMQGARLNVLQAQKTLSDFVQQTGLAQGEDLSSEGAQAADMGSQLATAESRAAASRQSAFEGQQGRGDAEKSAAVQQLRQQVAQQSAKLSQLETVYGPEHSEVRRTRAEVATLQSRLGSEVSNATSAFASQRAAAAAAERQAAAASEQRLRALASQQRARVQSMGTNVARYTTLKNEFLAAQRNYNDLNQRLSAMRLQSAVPQTEVQVLDKASRFLASSTPNPQLTLTLATLIGLLIGAITAVVLEFLNPRVRSWRGIERMLGTKVIGRVALPRRGPLNLPGAGPALLEARAS